MKPPPTIKRETLPLLAFLPGTFICSTKRFGEGPSRPGGLKVNNRAAKERIILARNYLEDLGATL